MAGYNGYSMSNNAVEAYESGEKPLGKWTKADIMAAVKNLIDENELTFSLDLLAKIKLAALKDLLLVCSSWHHTSSYYNETNFYEVSASVVGELTDEKIMAAIEQSKQQEKKQETQPEKWLCEYLVWGGTRKHPTATECTATGEIKGNWFYLPDGSKKSITANGFKRIKKIGGSK